MHKRRNIYLPLWRRPLRLLHPEEVAVPEVLRGRVPPAESDAQGQGDRGHVAPVRRRRREGAAQQVRVGRELGSGKWGSGFRGEKIMLAQQPWRGRNDNLNWA